MIKYWSGFVRQAEVSNIHTWEQVFHQYHLSGLLIARNEKWSYGLLICRCLCGLAATVMKKPQYHFRCHSSCLSRLKTLYTLTDFRDRCYGGVAANIRGRRWVWINGKMALYCVQFFIYFHFLPGSLKNVLFTKIENILCLMEKSQSHISLKPNKNRFFCQGKLCSIYVLLAQHSII